MSFFFEKKNNLFKVKIRTTMNLYNSIVKPALFIYILLSIFSLIEAQQQEAVTGWNYNEAGKDWTDTCISG